MTFPTGYYNRFDPADNYEKHLFRAGYVLQSAELNETQEYPLNRMKMLGDALFKDGDIVRDARVVVDPATGATTCEAGAIYLRGAVRGIPPATLTIPTTGTVAVGIYLVESTVTENEDPGLKEPAAETRNYQESGASRLKVEPKWGFNGDDQEGEFFPVYYVEDGALRAKEAPPQLDSVSQALARYDRDSAGSNYVVAGMRVSKLADLPNGNQVYDVQDGRARVNGFGVNLDASRRVIYPAVPDLRFIDSEPHTSTTVGSQRINLDRTPISALTQVRITAEQTDTLSHGTFVGAQDPISNTSIIDIIEVKQGGTTYVKNTDYKLTAGKVDWSLTGSEPATGSSYTVKYQFIKTVTPTGLDDTGFTITGAVVGTLVMSNYSVKLPRIDRLCMSEDGVLLWIPGVATDYDPVRPPVPNNMLALAQITQTWTSGRSVVNDGVRVVPMSDLEAMNFRMDRITDLVAQNKLVSDIVTREASAKKGLFVDPFLDDGQRDSGISQTAAVANGVLTLPVAASVLRPAQDIATPASCAYTLETILSQNSRTGSMKINPYMAFGILPSQVTLNPPVDRWTEVQTAWASAVTQAFVTGAGGIWGTLQSTSSSQSTQLVKTTNTLLTYLRPIAVRFNITGFGPGEQLASVTFDGLAVTATT